MAIARSQIEEVYQVLSEHVQPGELRPLLARLKATQAYERNASFRETIDRLETHHFYEGKEDA